MTGQVLVSASVRCDPLNRPARPVLYPWQRRDGSILYHTEGEVSQLQGVCFRDDCHCTVYYSTYTEYLKRTVDYPCLYDAWPRQACAKGTEYYAARTKAYSGSLTAFRIGNGLRFWKAVLVSRNRSSIQCILS